MGFAATLNCFIYDVINISTVFVCLAQKHFGTLMGIASRTINFLKYNLGQMPCMKERDVLFF